MKHLKTVEVPATTREVVERTNCDLCGAELRSIGSDYDEVTIERSRGVRLPGCSRYETEVDMCGHCFETRLVPWLNSQGAQVIENDFDT